MSPDTRAFFTRKRFPFLLAGEMRGRVPFQDVRTATAWIEPAVANYLNNPHLQPVSPCVVHVWEGDFDAVSELLAHYRDRGVSVARIEPLAADSNARAQLFADGYARLVRETGFDLITSPCDDEDYLERLYRRVDVENAANRARAVLGRAAE
jgi:hypothetical protein